MLKGLVACVQLVQEILWLAPNAYSLLHSCAWFDDFVSICGVLRWSLWNLVSIYLLSTCCMGHRTGWKCRWPCCVLLRRSC
jgi:hypothetical protein